MSINGWQYYHHALIPTGPPTGPADTGAMDRKRFWSSSQEGVVLLARWTSEFDCGHETGWWYVVKDAPLNMDALKAKRRYEINKGLKNFEIRPIAPRDYPEELYRVRVAAYSAYPAKYHPAVDHDRFVQELTGWDDCLVYGASFRETGELTGYGLLKFAAPDFLSFMVLETKPEFEKYAVNAAIVAEILEQNRTFLECGGILCDGARSISHETKFQNYLEKYFEFRKAYCVLHVAYNPKIRWAVRIAYPFRRALGRLDGIGIVHQLNAVLKMEEIVRSQK